MLIDLTRKSSCPIKNELSLMSTLVVRPYSEGACVICYFSFILENPR